jgi:hypothetical protein
MPELVTIESVTANTPVEIYYCNVMSGGCEYVATVATFPYTFIVPQSASSEDFIVKIVDIYSQEFGEEVFVTPTPTVSPTITPSPTPSVTPTTSLTPSITPTITPTISLTPSITPTITPSQTATPTIYPHEIGLNKYDVSSSSVCDDNLTILNYFTYLSDGPIALGIVVYEVNAAGTLFNPVVGEDKYIKMQWNNDIYQVQINNIGEITDFVLCV